jgi:hypothetical protein
MKVVNDKNLDLEYDEELRCIIQTWKGYFNSDYFKQGVERTNKLFEEKRPVHKFLVDARNASVVKKEDTDWAAKTAIPKSIKNGLQFYGFVLPTNVFTQISLGNFQKELNQPELTVMLFDDIDKAKDWMRSL